MPNRGLIYKTYKEPRKLDIKKTSNLIKNGGTNLYREFSKEKTQMTEKCSTFLVIRGMQIKTNLKFILHWSEWQRSINQMTAHSDEYVE